MATATKSKIAQLLAVVASNAPLLSGLSWQPPSLRKKTLSYIEMMSTLALNGTDDY